MNTNSQNIFPGCSQLITLQKQYLPYSISKYASNNLRIRHSSKEWPNNGESQLEKKVLQSTPTHSRKCQKQHVHTTGKPFFFQILNDWHNAYYCFLVTFSLAFTVRPSFLPREQAPSSSSTENPTKYARQHLAIKVCTLVALSSSPPSCSFRRPQIGVRAQPCDSLRELFPGRILHPECDCGFATHEVLSPDIIAPVDPDPRGEKPLLNLLITTVRGLGLCFQHYLGNRGVFPLENTDAESGVFAKRRGRSTAIV